MRKWALVAQIHKGQNKWDVALWKHSIRNHAPYYSDMIGFLQRSLNSLKTVCYLRRCAGKTQMCLFGMRSVKASLAQISTLVTDIFAFPLLKRRTERWMFLLRCICQTLEHPAGRYGFPAELRAHAAGGTTEICLIWELLAISMFADHVRICSASASVSAVWGTAHTEHVSIPVHYCSIVFLCKCTSIFIN